jgi:hypothetical protein
MGETAKTTVISMMKTTAALLHLNRMENVERTRKAVAVARMNLAAVLQPW